MRQGESGARVRELHQRLETLGYQASDPPETYGDATSALVEAFQHSRGLPITGEVDDTTWDRLVEAGWSIGDRLLFLSRPHLRGDDVAELQVQLAQIGFNPGRIDGIFGAGTDTALRDFQQHRGLLVDGTLTRATLSELRRMVRRDTAGQLVTDALDLATAGVAMSGPVVVCGSGSLVARVARDCTGHCDVVELADVACEEVAQSANSLGASLVLSFAERADSQEIHVHYWASYKSHSRRGERVASALASRLSHSPDLPRVEVTGMALPILRETAMTTLHIEHGPASEEALSTVARDIATIVDRVIHNQR